MNIKEYNPKLTLVVPKRPVRRAKSPFIDVHNHQRLNLSANNLDKLVKEMVTFYRSLVWFVGALPLRNACVAAMWF